MANHFGGFSERAALGSTDILSSEMAGLLHAINADGEPEHLARAARRESHFAAQLKAPVDLKVETLPEREAPGNVSFSLREYTWGDADDFPERRYSRLSLSESVDAFPRPDSPFPPNAQVIDNTRKLERVMEELEHRTGKMEFDLHSSRSRSPSPVRSRPPSPQRRPPVAAESQQREPHREPDTHREHARQEETHHYAQNQPLFNAAATAASVQEAVRQQFAQLLREHKEAAELRFLETNTVKSEVMGSVLAMLNAQARKDKEHAQALERQVAALREQCAAQAAKLDRLAARVDAGPPAATVQAKKAEGGSEEAGATLKILNERIDNVHAQLRKQESFLAERTDGVAKELRDAQADFQGKQRELTRQSAAAVQEELSRVQHRLQRRLDKLKTDSIDQLEELARSVKRHRQLERRHRDRDNVEDSGGKQMLSAAEIEAELAALRKAVDQRAEEARAAAGKRAGEAEYKSALLENRVFELETKVFEALELSETRGRERQRGAAGHEALLGNLRALVEAVSAQVAAKVDKPALEQIMKHVATRHDLKRLRDSVLSKIKDARPPAAVTTEPAISTLRPAAGMTETEVKQIIAEVAAQTQWVGLQDVEFIVSRQQQQQQVSNKHQPRATDDAALDAKIKTLLHEHDASKTPFTKEEVVREVQKHFDALLHATTTAAAIPPPPLLSSTPSASPHAGYGQWVWKSGRLSVANQVQWDSQTYNAEDAFPGTLAYEQSAKALCYLWNTEVRTGESGAVAHARRRDCVRVLQPGIYEITFAFFTRQRPRLTLVVNGTAVCTALNSPGFVVRHPEGTVSTDNSERTRPGCYTGVSMVEFLALPADSTVAIEWANYSQNIVDACGGATAKTIRGVEGFMGLRRL